jgi:RimJ/RimL family protein N-acetyltransferase
MATENLSMKPFEEGDGAAVYAYWKSDPGWEKYNASVPLGFTEQDANDFVEEMYSRDRMIRPNWALVHEDIVVGVVSLSFDGDHRTALLGYGVHAKLRGRGLTIEAVATVLDGAFSEYPKLQTVQARTDAKNVASIRVLKKLGFSKVNAPGDKAEEPDASAHDSTFHLMRTEWRTRNDA